MDSSGGTAAQENQMVSTEMSCPNNVAETSISQGTPKAPGLKDNDAWFPVTEGLVFKVPPQQRTFQGFMVQTCGSCSTSAFISQNMRGGLDDYNT